MKKFLYKYVGPAFIDKVFSAQGQVSLKCGYPAEFNDPYELFLTMDFGESPELLAFYADVIGQLPQLPTTCFSRSPAVLPMWAHYASNLQGFVLELDEEALSAQFPDSGFGDVDYQDKPNEVVASDLARAYEIGKFRYMHFLQKSVFSAAYYTKQTCWSYEQERRMVVDPRETTHRDNVVLLEIPSSCVTSIICGPRADEKVVEALNKKAQETEAKIWHLKVGKSTGVPFFSEKDCEPSVFDGSQLALSSAYCLGCKEPVKEGRDQCSWCQINESHKEDAARRNSYRVLERYGMLESYIEGVNEIAKRGRTRGA